VVSIDNLANEIAKHLKEFTSFVEDEVEIAKEEVSKIAVAKLKETSPKLKGKYAKGWARIKLGNGIIIYNKTSYQLTHVLEHGHVNRDGSRTQGIAHIRPAEEQVVNEYISRVERAIRS
jgi:hypothetical protein